MGELVRAALAGLRARRGRTLLAAAGIVAAALVIGTSATVGYGLATGFDRSAQQADLPDVIARFDAAPMATLESRVRALPNLQAASYRYERNDVDLFARGHFSGKGALQVVMGGRRGYAITAGRDLREPGEVVVERGLAREWGLRPGGTLEVFGGYPLRIVGVAVSPDNVAYPIASAPRVYVGRNSVRPGIRPNLALLWLNDPSKAAVTLTQARSVSFGIGNLAFLTREGVRALLDQAAGIVLALLTAFSLVALLAAATMLAASAQAEVQRRLPALGVQRVLGFTPGRLAAQQATEAVLVAVPAGALGLALGTLAVAGPSGDLLAALNEQPPGRALLAPLALCLAAVVALVTAAATWPAWRAARRPPAAILRGGELAGRRPRAGGSGLLGLAGRRVPPAGGSGLLGLAGRRPRAGGSGLLGLAGRRVRAGASGDGGGMLGLGARFALAARARWAAAVATVAVCAGIVLLMLGLATLLERLRDDPGTVGKRYQLTAQLDPSLEPAVRALPGVAAVGTRYEADVSDAFRLGEPLRLVAYPGDHTAFEAPPLAQGRRVRAPGEAEVGIGLADALGLRPGSPFAVQTATGEEVRFRVVGVVRALERQGRIAWVLPNRLLAADPTLTPTLAIRLRAGADPARVAAGLRDLGGPPQPVGGASTDNRGFLGILAAVLRGVGLAVGLVALYALVQALAMTARERRGAVALLRATGADARTVGLVLAGAALAVALPAALAGVALEAAVLAPLVARLAASYAALPLAPSPGQVVLVAGGLLALAALAAALVARRALREPVLVGLREE